MRGDRLAFGNGLQRHVRRVSASRFAAARAALYALGNFLDVAGPTHCDVPRRGADRGPATAPEVAMRGVYWDAPAGLLLGDELVVGVALTSGGLAVLQVQGLRPPRRESWAGGSARNAVLLALAELAPELPLLSPDGLQKVLAVADEHGGPEDEWARGEGAPTLDRLRGVYERLPPDWRWGREVAVFPNVLARRCLLPRHEAT